MYYVLTYDHPHCKTQDLLFRFKCAGFNDIRVLVFPWEERKNFNPLFKIKPEPLSYTPIQVCKVLNYDCELMSTHITDDHLPVEDQVVFIAGAGILPEKFVDSNTVINSHCGWLPFVRGLDALKWAIFYGEPIGVTTHIVDATCDGGELLERREVPLYPQDTLYSIAIRQYELEINMMVDVLVGEKWKHSKYFTEPKQNPNRRMKHSIELQMIEKLKQRLLELPI